ncbi:MAG TPA: Arm DNA-binding domain-containing protein, partial [Xanthobacteraceae bacterium]
MARILTQAAIEKLPSPTSRREIPDGLVAGLYLIHQPSGARSWAVRFRHAGKPVKLTIGSYPTIPLAKARELGRDAILAAKQGRNPVDERKAER